MKYSLCDIARITGSRLRGVDMVCDRIISDSRSIVESEASLFVAMQGLNHDGHNYIGEMYQRGVRAFIVSREPDLSKFPDAGFVVTGDSLTALQSLAAHHRAGFKGKVVAITGSNGKTVTKEWISQLCPDRIRMFRSPRSYNSQLGVPLSLLMLGGNEQIAVIEAGISKPGEMERLEAIIKPDIGIITNIGRAHQENFSSLEEKLDEKLILFRDCKTIIYNSDMEMIDTAVRNEYSSRKLFTAGTGGRDIFLEKGAGGEVSIRFRSGNTGYSFRLPFSDNASVENAVQALSLFLVLGFEPKDMIPNLGKLQPVAMRLELKEGLSGSVIVNDTYNSDINSLSVALDYLGSVSGNRRKVLILSDILQTGMLPTELYGEVSELVDKNGIDLLIGVGENIILNSHLFHCRKIFYPATSDFIIHIDKSLFAGSAVLIKGSRQFHFEKISRLLENKIHTTVLEVDLDAMVHNLNHARASLGRGVKVMAMVKALSYGSGSYEVASILQHQRVDYLAVAFADEGVTLREAGITIPIVVLNADSWSFSLMIEYRLEPEIYSFSSLEMFIDELNRHGERDYPIHIKIDTGMHRLGFLPGEADELVRIIRNDNTVYIHSVFTHFAVSDDPSQDDFTLAQIERFDAASRTICEAFPHRKILRHAANSAAIERFPQAQFDMVRLGIGLYGISSVDQDKLQVVSTLKSRIVQIKRLKEGDTVGYCRNGKITGDTTIATIPVGYADGLDRRLGNGNWSFMIKGKPAPIVGNVCMDTCMADVTGIDVREGDEAVIFGEEPTVIEMARKLETIPYEIFTSVSSRVKRVYTKE